MQYFARAMAVLGVAAIAFLSAGCSGGAGQAASSMVPTASSAARAVQQDAASTASTADSTIPTHIPTWAFDEYGAEGSSASSSAVQQYVTYAEGGEGNAKAVADCDQSSTHACNSVFYIDPNFLYASANCPAVMAAQVASIGSESWYVHESGYSDAAHRAHGSYSQYCQSRYQTVPVYLLNESSPAVQSYFASYVHEYANQWDAFFMDDTSGSVLTQGYGPGGGFCPDSNAEHYCYATQEYPTNAAVVAAHAAFVNSINHVNGSPTTYFFNGIGFSDGQPTNLALFQASSRFAGASCENCVINASEPRPTMYADVLTAMAQIDQIPGAAFIEMNTATLASGTKTQQADRRITTAVAWLGYADGHTIVFPNLEDDTDNLAVWPEDMIYPSQPLQTMTSSANDIMVAPGVYRREFAACYDDGKPIGQCSAILNANATTVTVEGSWLKQSYEHILQLNGTDILSGGSLGLTNAYFVPNVTVLQPGAGTLLVK